MSQPIQLDTMMCQVSDMTAAAEFYRDVLGATVPFTSSHWTSVQLGSASIGLHSPLDGFTKNSGGWILGYQVTSILELRDRLVLLGVPILQGLHDVPGGVVILFADRDGNLLQPIQRGTTIAALGS